MIIIGEEREREKMREGGDTFVLGKWAKTENFELLFLTFGLKLKEPGKLEFLWRKPISTAKLKLISGHF